MRLRLYRSALFGLLWLAAAAPAPDWLTSQSALCVTAITAAEAKYQLPPHLLETIAQVESARPVGPTGKMQPWPWTIDADGQAVFLDSKAAAIVWAEQGLKRGIQFMDI